MTDTAHPESPAAPFRGAVTCRRSRNALTLTGAAADSADDILILTFITPAAPDLPDSLAGATVRALDERRYRISSGPQDWVVEATSVHVHRDIGATFHRAIPPRLVPLQKRLFWRMVLALAGTRTGKSVLLFLRRRA
ncbi:MAG: hypothetical protein KGO22_13825 [Gammaproteobacteria bacterium]|nr:hypothetical protein [Gammaproteobacteria bacterium]